MATRSEKINDILKSIRTSTPEVIGASVVNSEGFTIASLLPAEVDEELVAGMSAALLGVGEKISSDLTHAEMEQTYVRSSKGYIIINSISDESALVLLVTREARPELFLLGLKRALTDLARLV